MIDLSEWFRDPHVSPAMRHMTGHDQDVVDSVMRAPGAHEFVDRLMLLAAALVDLELATVTLAVGCVGGRHRSVVVAEQLAAQARSAVGWTVELEHRDLNKPVLASARKMSAADQVARG